MALSQAQQAALATMIAQEGGLSTFTAEVQALYIASTQASALTTLAPAITVTVQSWPTIAAYVAASTNATLYSCMAAINTEAAAARATNLGPLFVQLYAAVKVHLNL